MPISCLSIYVDMDGVLADFDQYFFDYYGKFFRDYEEEEAWDCLKKIPDFWLDLPPMPGMKELWSYLKSTEASVMLLTSPGSHDEIRARLQKRIWVNKTLGSDVPIIFKAAKYKHRLADKDAILIDDMERNINQWVEAGGSGIQHVSTENTIVKLESVFTSSKYLNWMKTGIA